MLFYRRMPKFDYLKPKSLDEVLGLLKQNNGGKLKVYAGGTDLIPKIKCRLISVPEAVVDLKGLPGLDHISYDRDGELRIGALASIHAVANSSYIKEKYPMLSHAAGSIASTQIQNRGTLAGNICNAVPSADSAPALLCLDAKVLCESHEGERFIALKDFFTGPRQTILNEGDLVKEIVVPPPQGKGVYIKLSPRSRMDLAVVGVAAFADVKEGVIEEIRIALGAVAPTPIRAKRSESLMRGERIGKALIEEAARMAAEDSRPIDDHRASAEYRRLMVEVLVKRALRKIVEN